MRAPSPPLAAELMSIPGVIATGLLMGVASAAVVASPSSPRVLPLALDPAQQAAKEAPEQQQPAAGGAAAAAGA